MCCCLRFDFTYHYGERRAIHEDGENGSSKAAEELSVLAVQCEERDQRHGGEGGHRTCKQPADFRLFLLRRVDQEDQHVDDLNRRPCPVDRRYQ